jgi:hypothetical protein
VKSVLKNVALALVLRAAYRVNLTFILIPLDFVKPVTLHAANVLVIRLRNVLVVMRVISYLEQVALESMFKYSHHYDN